MKGQLYRKQKNGDKGLAVITLIAAVCFAFFLVQPGLCELKLDKIGSMENEGDHCLINSREHEGLNIERAQLLDIVNTRIHVGEMHLTMKDHSLKNVFSFKLGDAMEKDTRNCSDSSVYKLVAEGGWSLGEYSVTWSVS